MVATATFPTIQQPYRIEGDRLVLDFHPGQWRAWDSIARFVVVLAGTQGGKTSFGPHWLYREIAQRGPGDYLVVTPTFPLLAKKALPEFLHIFEDVLKLGRYVGSAVKTFTLSKAGEMRLFGSEQKTPTKVFFGHAQDPESLESATAKAAWLDEAGQTKFRLSSYEAILRRLSIAIGRILITTTPYNLGWLKQRLFDKRHSDSDIDVIQFDSTENPAFPPEEMERARRDLPRWKYDMYYRAVFTRPAGMIYDCFDEKRHVVPPFAIGDDWPRYMGLDFGGVNTAAVKIAKNPKAHQWVIYDEYLRGSMTAADHARALLANEKGIPQTAGGSRSERQWRNEFGAAGLPVHPTHITSVEVGIDKVYGAISRGELLVFNTLDRLLDELGSYSRELDDMGEPTETIADKNTYHLLDALRYIGSHLFFETEG